MSNIEYPRDVNGFVMPPILASTDHVRTTNLLFSLMPLALLVQANYRERALFRT
jgi:hypothetical protein